MWLLTEEIGEDALVSGSEWLWLAAWCRIKQGLSKQLDKTTEVHLKTHRGICDLQKYTSTVLYRKSVLGGLYSHGLQYKG